MINKPEIELLVNRILSSEKDKFQDSNIFLVDFKISNNNRITIHLDSDNGIKLADCAVLSKSIENELDRESEDFELIVSSAGLDKPFKVFNQYKKNIGKMVEAQTKEGITLTGVLKEVHESHIIIEPKKKKKNKEAELQVVNLNFEHLKQVKLIISF